MRLSPMLSVIFSTFLTFGCASNQPAQKANSPADFARIISGKEYGFVNELVSSSIDGRPDETYGIRGIGALASPLYDFCKKDAGTLTTSDKVKVEGLGYLPTTLSCEDHSGLRWQVLLQYLSPRSYFNRSNSTLWHYATITAEFKTGVVPKRDGSGPAYAWCPDDHLTFRSSIDDIQKEIRAKPLCSRPVSMLALNVLNSVSPVTAVLYMGDERECPDQRYTLTQIAAAKDYASRAIRMTPAEYHPWMVKLLALRPSKDYFALQRSLNQGAGCRWWYNGDVQEFEDTFYQSLSNVTNPRDRVSLMSSVLDDVFYAPFNHPVALDYFLTGSVRARVAKAAQNNLQAMIPTLTGQDRDAAAKLLSQLGGQ